MRAKVGVQFDGWASSFGTAVSKVSWSWLESLRRLAQIKAASLEAETCRCRMAEWQIAIGAKSSSIGTVAPMPTKAAY
eukprot:1028673-Karenia_brevis.AAC.1